MLVGGLDVIQGRNVRFIISDNRIIVSTTLQAFILQPSDHCWNKRLDTIRMLMVLGQINDINDVAEACVDHSKGAARRVIQWIPTQVPVTL